MTLAIDHRLCVVREFPVDRSRVTRAASVALFSMAAAVVVYGAVPTERITIGSQSRLTLAHDRFGSVGKPQIVVLRVARNSGEPVSIRLDDATTKHFALQRTQPIADTLSTDGSGAVLTFGTGTNSEVFEVALTFTPLEWGPQQLSLSASIAQRLTVQAAINQFVAPL